MKRVTHKNAPPPEAGHLAQITLFEGISQTQLRRIEKHLHERVFPAGTVFIHQGQSGDGLYFLMRGTVKAFLAPGNNSRSEGSRNESSKGESSKDEKSARETPAPNCPEAVIAIYAAGDTLGEIDLTDGRGHMASVAALEESHLWWMASADFWHCHRVMPQLGRNLCRLLAQRMRGCTAVHDVLTGLRLPGKVAFHLLLLARDHGRLQSDGSVLVPVSLSQSEMASLVGASREQVSRVLKRLAKQGCIQKYDQRWLIRDEAALRCHCEGRWPAPGVPEPNGAAQPNDAVKPNAPGPSSVRRA